MHFSLPSILTGWNVDKNLSAAAVVLREHALKPAIEDLDKDFAVDIIGTEGDEFNLFSVSTAAGITADADVIKVCHQSLQFNVPISESA